MVCTGRKNRRRAQVQVRKWIRNAAALEHAVPTPPKLIGHLSSHHQSQPESPVERNWAPGPMQPPPHINASSRVGMGTPPMYPDVPIQHGPPHGAPPPPGHWGYTLQPCAPHFVPADVHGQPMMMWAPHGFMPLPPPEFMHPVPPEHLPNPRFLRDPVASRRPPPPIDHIARQFHDHRPVLAPFPAAPAPAPPPPPIAGINTTPPMARPKEGGRINDALDLLNFGTGN